jgi:hypothetical protein
MFSPILNWQKYPQSTVDGGYISIRLLYIAWFEYHLTKFKDAEVPGCICACLGDHPWHSYRIVMMLLQQ